MSLAVDAAFMHVVIASCSSVTIWLLDMFQFLFMSNSSSSYLLNGSGRGRVVIETLQFSENKDYSFKSNTATNWTVQPLRILRRIFNLCRVNFRLNW